MILVAACFRSSKAFTLYVLTIGLNAGDIKVCVNR